MYIYIYNWHQGHEEQARPALGPALPGEMSNLAQDKGGHHNNDNNNRDNHNLYSQSAENNYYLAQDKGGPTRQIWSKRSNPKPGRLTGRTWIRPKIPQHVLYSQSAENNYYLAQDKGGPSKVAS